MSLHDLAEHRTERTQIVDGFTFQEWPKTHRLFRTVVITEKIDGTNAAIHVSPDGRVAAQSRKRLITPTADNYALAVWVHEHADTLAAILGPGVHFGEWWGNKIQRGYGLDARTFSLFNTGLWGPSGAAPLEPRIVGAATLDVVPVLHEGLFSEDAIRFTLERLTEYGSVAAPGFMNPEGICIFHTMSRQVMKVTLDNYDAGKWEALAA
ncbi:RNA ligase family protein [Streptomyces uncialis]|uniref:RNA ligase family protein n=1 Tax=Streptomyces uncialis TaxID=1048205 RepID=UPI00380E4A03